VLDLPNGVWKLRLRDVCGFCLLSPLRAQATPTLCRLRLAVRARLRLLPPMRDGSERLGSTLCADLDPNAAGDVLRHRR
jgi:hypothetical protein